MPGDACLWSQPILPLGITDPAALAAMQTVAREASVRPGLVELAFDDLSAHWGWPDHLSPIIVALVTAMLRSSPVDRV